MKILTVTMNPAFDVHCEVENFTLYKENYVSECVKHAGGKGINISRALCTSGVENTALCVIGKENGDEFLGLLSKGSVKYRYILIEGRIRENITIHSEDKETRISFEGFTLDKKCIREILDIIKEEQTENMIVAFAGRLNSGMDNCRAVEFLREIKDMGAKLIVDCNLLTLSDLSEIKPYLIKPNEQEIFALTGMSAEDEKTMIEAAENLRKCGVENVMISLGGRGMIFCGSEGAYRVTVPKITPVSTIGAGDSTLAGFIRGLAYGNDIKELLKSSAAYGTAACLEEGTNPPHIDNISRIKENVIVERI